MPIEIPDDYSYVLAVIAASGIVSLWHGMKVGLTRKAAGVPYPNAYASHEEAQKDPKKLLFNSAQRAHANYMENWITTVPMLAIAGLKYPTYAAAAGGVWLAGRIAYQIGYLDISKKDGTGRYKGAFNHLGQFGLLGMASYTIFQLITQ